MPTIIVTAGADQDDCLTAAAEEYIADHADLAGWDLAPRWTDDERETVTLTVPEWHANALAGDAQSIEQTERERDAADRETDRRIDQERGK